MPATREEVSTFFDSTFRGSGFAVVNLGARQDVFFAWPEEKDKLLAQVKEWSAIEGANVYYVPTLFKARRRIKENVTDAVTTLYADLDACYPSTCLVRPTIAIESSPGRYQALWLLDNPIGKFEAEELNKRIAYRHADQGADKSGWDLTQLLRVPGTINWKKDYNRPTVSLMWSEPSLYRPEEFAEYPEVSGPPTQGTRFEVEPLDVSLISDQMRHLFEEPIPEKEGEKRLYAIVAQAYDEGLPVGQIVAIGEHWAANYRPRFVGRIKGQVARILEKKVAEDEEALAVRSQTLNSKNEERKLRVEIEKVKRRRMVEATAVRELAAENWSEPEDDGSLDEQFANPAEDPPFLVYSLFPGKGIHQVVAQWKAGKTTLIDVNLAASLATGQPFLNSYQVNFDTGNIGIWNLEVSAGTLQQWLFAKGLDERARKRIFPLHLRGKDVDLMSPVAADWAVRWLKSHGIKAWIIDPQSKLYRGKENDSTEFNEWWRTLEEVARRADVPVVINVHHTGHGNGDNEAMPRSRGSSAMMGNPDVLVSYRHGGAIGELPPDSRRYLSAFGRNVDFKEITIDFDPTTQGLYEVGNSEGRDGDRVRRLAVKAYVAVKKADEDGKQLNATELKKCMGHAKDELKVTAISFAEAENWIVVNKQGNAKLHGLGTSAP